MKSERIRDLLKFKKRMVSFQVMTILLVGCEGITEVPETASRFEQSSAGEHQALVYETNPVVASGSTSATYSALSSHLVTQFITANNYLEEVCSFNQAVSTTSYYTDTTSNSCILVLNDANASTQNIQKNGQTWAYDNFTDEFYQVNTFYHMNKITQRFLSSLKFAHETVHFKGQMTLPPATKSNFVSTKSYWLTKENLNKTLKAYSKCKLERLNAYFDPTKNELCFGYTEADENFRMVQDPSVIYHEMGHAFVKIMMNQRNITNGFNPATGQSFFGAHPFESELGTSFYDEAGSINEGIADYFSYYMNSRKKVGEFALKKILGNHRPLSEDDDAHSANISTNTGERLSYPQFLYYDPNNPTTNIEDVHYAGQIITHYLVALTEELKNKCSFTSTDSNIKHQVASDYVFLLLNETMAEMGDLTGKASDFFNPFSVSSSSIANTVDNAFFVNLNDTESYLWSHYITPPNFRNFFRIFGKNILHHVSGLNQFTPGLCPEFTVDNSEQLLDEYGLLLFKSYEDKGKGFDQDTGSALSFLNFYNNSIFTSRNLQNTLIFSTEVNEQNRKYTNLVSKNLITLDEDSPVYLFDGQNDIKEVLANLTFEGKNVVTTQGISGTEYNNPNGKIGPGEVVGINLNLYNDSNSDMAGIQILANDWDHMKIDNTASRFINMIKNNNKYPGQRASYSPCMFDNFPTVNQGGIDPSTETVNTADTCSNITKDNSIFDTSTVDSGITYPKYQPDAPQPICLVQYNGESESKWVSQDFFRTVKLGLEDSSCLNNPQMAATNEFNPNECLIRALPGANQAILGKISPQSNWVSTLQGDDSSNLNIFSSSNIILFEVNKWINPGTVFNCRLRVRFSNCSDCYATKDVNNKYPEFYDYEYAGRAPYKIINFQFTVE